MSYKRTDYGKEDIHFRRDVMCIVCADY